MVATPLLEARNLSRVNSDGRRRLLANVSLAVAAGERISISGPSGAGKTLLLRSLVLLDPLDGGQVLWRGRPVRHDAVPTFRRTVVYLHQRPSLVADTVEAALQRPYALKVHRDARFDRRRVVELLNRLGRDDSFLEKQVGDLSGGEIQVTALVRALQLEPTVLLLDEPTAALDPAAAAAVERLLDGWAGDSSAGRAMLWVSHDAQQAARVADRRIRMDGGSIVADSQLTTDHDPTTAAHG